MERKRALKFPFTIDKDKKVSWTELAGQRHCDSQIKNGALLFGHNHIAKKPLKMPSKEPCLILTDVLKSEEARPYLEKIKHPCSSQKPGQKEHVQRKEEGFICKDKRTSQRMANYDNNRHVKPRSKRMTTSSPSPRSRLQRRSQNIDDADEEQENDLEDVNIGQEFRGGCRFAEVVDCGLSVSWKPAKDKEGCEGFSPGSIKDKDILHTWKRKKQNTESKCNETSKPKHRRLSVLRLSGETEREGPSSPTYICLQEGAHGRRVGRSATTHVCLGEYVEECPGLTRIPLDGGEDRREEEPASLQERIEDVHLHNLDHSIVQFTVGANDPTEVLLPIIDSSLEPVDILGSVAKTNPSEPIVLSSDDEDEGEKSCDVPQRCRQGVSVEDAVIQGKSPQEAKQQEEVSDTEDAELLHVVVDDVPSVAVSLPSKVCMVLAFSSLYCGVYHGKSNGDIMLTEQNLIIPLKDKSEHLEVVLALERKKLRRYSVWEKQEMEAQDINFKCDEDLSPPTALMLCVSQTAAAAAQRELLNLCLKQDETTDIEQASPFMILTLDDPLEGMQGALFRSLLDIDCLNNFTESFASCYPEENNLLKDVLGPFLSLDESIKLIRKTGRECHLLSLLGLEKINEDEDGLLCDPVQNTSPLIHLEGDSQERMEQKEEEEEEKEVDIESELQPQEEHREQEVKSPAAKTKEEPTSMYTLCHRRTKGSYSMSLCKPDSSWIKYRHEGLAYGLIQFPPPPLKGGITVTMEDLQCLDSGEFLNDVIIDFYLKYLLHKAAAAVTERCHIFSSFFFKQLTRRDNASEGSTKDVCQRQRRHQRVKTWTRHVDIFNKDFLFVPVNQEAHWYLVVICFPGMTEPKVEVWKCPESNFQTGNSQTCELPDLKAPNNDTEIAPTSNRREHMDTETETTQDQPTESAKPGPVCCTEGTCQRKTVCKRPCILVMDSLKRSLHERVFKLLRDYLESEWEVRRGSARDFGADQMQSSHCKVPLQDNSTDCGLYLLQYVESFLKDPVVHFDLPLHLERWFPRQQVRRKRDEIRDLVLNLYSRQQLDSKR